MKFEISANKFKLSCSFSLKWDNRSHLFFIEAIYDIQWTLVITERSPHTASSFLGHVPRRGPLSLHFFLFLVVRVSQGFWGTREHWQNIEGNKGKLANFWEQGNKIRKITVQKHSERVWEHGNIGNFGREQGNKDPPGRPSVVMPCASNDSYHIFKGFFLFHYLKLGRH